MLNIPRLLAGFALSVVIGWLAYRRGALTLSGWAGAVFTGTCTFGFGGWAWGLTLIVFFVTSTLLSRFRHAQKERLAGEKFEKGSQRDLFQALANGGAGALLALGYGLLGEPPLLLAAFAGVMATVTADTWATEIGVLSDRTPVSITTLRPTTPGSSGGVTIDGTLAGAAGAVLIGMVVLAGHVFERGVLLLWLVPAALIGGVAGNLADSLLGGTVQAIYRTETQETERAYRGGVANQLVRGWRWMNNDMVNFLSSLVGGLCALGVARAWGE